MKEASFSHSRAEYLEAAMACIADGEHETVSNYFLGTDLVNVDELRIDELDRAKLVTLEKIAQQDPFVPLSSEDMEQLTPDHMRARAESLFGELPIQIKDPVNRGRERPITWTNIEMDKPSVFDLVSLSRGDLDKYHEVLRLAERAGVPMMDLHLKAHYTFYRGQYVRHHIPKHLRPERQTPAIIQKLAGLVGRVIRPKSLPTSV